MRINADFTQAGSGALPAGKYELQIDNAEPKISQKTGNEYLSITMKVIAHPEYDGYKLFYNAPTTGKGAFRLARVLEAIGIGAEGINEFDTDDLLGHKLNGIVQYELDEQGQKRRFPSVTDVFKSE